MHHGTLYPPPPTHTYANTHTHNNHPGGHGRGEAAGHRGGVRLPDAALECIMEKLADSLEPGGVYGPGLVARDIANASLVSRVWPSV